MNTRTILFCTLLVFLIADVVTTTYALQAGGVEGNPVAALFAGSPLLHLLVKLLFAGVVLLLARQTDRIRPDAGTYCVAAAAAFYSLPVINNMMQILGI